MSHFRLDGMVAVVIGGGSGIGAATAAMMGDAGALVVVGDQNLRAAEETAERLAGTNHISHAVGVDVTDDAAVEALFEDVMARFGRVDALVNSAGIAIRRPALDLTREDWDSVVAVNMTGTFLCSRAAARHMIAGGRGGAVVNVASIMGLSGGGLYPNISYQTTKGAVVNMTRALAIEWASHKIRVNAVAPTFVRTPLIAPLLEQKDMVERIKAITPLGRLAEADEVAAAILYLVSPAAAMITGHTLPIDGGVLAQ